MISASLELQGAIVARLKGDGSVSGLVGDRVYDAVPPGVEFPLVSLGPSDELTDDVECAEGQEITLQIDAWSRAVGFPEVKAIAEAIRRALHDQDLALNGNALVYLRHRQTRVFRDPDGLTSHAALTFEAVVETS